MGLLNRMLGIVGEGLAKSASDALGKAVSQAVKPAATKFAEKQADLIDAVTKNVENAANQVNAAGDAMSEAASSTANAAAGASGAASSAGAGTASGASGAASSAGAGVDSAQLKMAMEFLRQNARNAAEEIANVKDDEKPSNEEVLAQWETKLPGYPVWNGGGYDLEYEDTTFGYEEAPCVSFNVSGVVEANVLVYVGSLLAHGFLPKYNSSSNQTWYKQVGTKYLAVFIDEMDNEYVRLAFYEESAKEIEKARLSR